MLISYYNVISVSTEVAEYRQLLPQVVDQLDSLIYDIDDHTMNPTERIKACRELKFDAIPILRKLKYAKKYSVFNILVRPFIILLDLFGFHR